MGRAFSIGIDTVEVRRIARLAVAYRKHFLGLVYTRSEQEYCRDQARVLASIYAAKEAISKALGVGFIWIASGGVDPRDLEISVDQHDRPSVCLHGEARHLAERLGLREWAISLSCSCTHAIAVAMAYPGVDLTD